MSDNFGLQNPMTHMLTQALRQAFNLEVEIRTLLDQHIWKRLTLSGIVDDHTYKSWNERNEYFVRHGIHEILRWFIGGESYFFDYNVKVRMDSDNGSIHFGYDLPKVQTRLNMFWWQCNNAFSMFYDWRDIEFAPAPQGGQGDVH